MRKILDTRHYENMIILLQRIKRKNLSSDTTRIEWHIKNYENLLKLVQDTY